MSAVSAAVFALLAALLAAEWVTAEAAAAIEGGQCACFRHELRLLAAQHDPFVEMIEIDRHAQYTMRIVSDEI